MLSPSLGRRTEPEALKLFGGYIRIMQKKMETTIVYEFFRGYIGTMGLYGPWGNFGFLYGLETPC